MIAITSRRHGCSSHACRRLPRPLPKLTLDLTVANLFAFREEHFTLKDYDPHPYIAAEVAV